MLSLPLMHLAVPKISEPTQLQHTDLQILIKNPEDNLFECYPDFATDEIFIRCNWAAEPCLVSIDFHDTENRHTYKLRRTLARGVQTLKFDVKNFTPGPYYVFIGNDEWNKVLDAGFVKVMNNK
jgi:hypothetical protein